MKKFKIFCMSLIIVTTFSIPVFAEGIGGKVLDLDSSIKSAIENSYMIKSKDNMLESSKKKKESDSKYVDMLAKRVEHSRETKRLEKKTDRTEKEEQLYRFYLMMYGEPMKDSELKEALKIIHSTYDEDEYTIFENTNAIEISKNNIKQNVYEEYGNLIKFKDNLDLTEKKFKVAEDEFNNIKLKVNIGLASKLEEKEKGKIYLKEKQNYENLKTQFNVKTMYFNKLIGAPLNQDYSAYSKEYYAGSLPNKSYDEYVKEALKNRAEVINGEKYLELKKAEKKDLTELYSEFHRESDIGDINYQSARDGLELKKLDIQLEIKRLYDELEVKYKNYEIVRKKAEEAKKKYDEYSKRYSLGMVSKIEYDKESLKLYNELVNYRNLERDIYILKLKLENACSLGTDVSKSMYSNMR